MQDKAQELLHHAHNKYELVLTIARRAKIIKDESGVMSAPETNKPINMALRELADLQRRDREATAY